MSNTVNEVSIRMYNTGSVGDCLLLLFKKNGEVTFRMLIDCGGFNTTSAAIAPCVKNISETCEGTVDLLVVTHQHEDHISGFNQARDIFDTIQVKQVWMSWIEDETDEIAKLVKDRFGKRITQLKAIAQKAAVALQKQQDASKSNELRKKKLGAKKAKVENILSLIEFEGQGFYEKTLAAGKRTNADAMDYIRGKGEKLEYYEPGEVIANVPGAEGLRFFILGPPRERDLRSLQIPTEDEEMYKNLRKSRANAEGQSSDAQPEPGLLSTGITLVDYRSPFETKYIAKGQALSKMRKEYNSPEMEWRQIESDWCETAAAIALRLTNLTNNTSFAMAIENKSSGKVLLMPADAQSGNWMSWHNEDINQKFKETSGKQIKDLLENTVLYKVGHHCSHNGTASKSGLEIMKHKDLVAMIPLVQEKVPSQWGGANNFPAKGLYNALIDKTRGRVVRTDEGVITHKKAKELRSKLPAQVRKQFDKGYKKGSCYVEFTLSLD